MGTMLTTSAILMLLIMLLFSFSINTIYRQKKLSEINVFWLLLSETDSKVAE
jgi:hypothetical protein